MKKMIWALVLAACPATAAAAQEFSMPWGTEWGVARERLGRHTSGSVALYGRASFPGDSDVTQDGVTYADLFDPGLGFSVEGDVLVDMTHDWSVGGYVSVGWDTFVGVREVDDFGDTLEPDTMELFSAIAGAKAVGTFDPHFFWEGRVGLGVVHYDAVEADFILSGTTFADQEFFRTSDRAVFELGGRIGMGTPHVAIALGMGFRIMGGPSRGKDVTNFIDPDPLVTFMLELGVMVRF
ncbi:MAG TPA: hypothetical protein VJB14_04080 [Planctomycetota bacterium]|nr:hypothetical protein [Planctomycetota bacterium]